MEKMEGCEVFIFFVLEEENGQNRRKSSLYAELTKMHSFRLFFGDFAHWEISVSGSVS